MYQLSIEYCLVYLLPLLSRLHHYEDLDDNPSKLQIRCIDIYLSSLLLNSSTSLGLLNAILLSMQKHDDVLSPSNRILRRLIVLCNQLVHKHTQTFKTVDISYSETIRLPAQYYKSKSNSVSKRQSGGSVSAPSKKSKQL